jgi:argininosuccinate lyase
LLATATFDTQTMARAAGSPALAATDLAEWLVQKGMPFRQAHELVGGVVRESVQRRVPLPELVAAHPSLGADAVALLEPGVAVSRRTTPGGAGPVPVAAQLGRFAAVVRAEAERLGMPRLGSAFSHPSRGHAHGVGQQHDGPGPDGGVPVGPSRSSGPATTE